MRVLFVWLAFCACVVTLSAHHSFAEYDAGKPLKMTGSITKIEWTNPHAWLFVDVKDENGTVRNWAFELGPPNALDRLGWTRTSMNVGDVVTVEGFRARSGKDVGNAEWIVFAATGERRFAASSVAAFRKRGR